MLESLFIERMELNEELFTDYMSKPELQKMIAQWLGNKVYTQLANPTLSEVSKIRPV